MRTKDGTCYHAGSSQSYRVGGSGSKVHITCTTVMQKVTNIKRSVYVSGNYSDHGLKAFWITDSGRSYCYGHDSRNSMLHLKQVQTGLVKMVITILSIGTHNAE